MNDRLTVILLFFLVAVIAYAMESVAGPPLSPAEAKLVGTWRFSSADNKPFRDEWLFSNRLVARRGAGESTFSLTGLQWEIQDGRFVYKHRVRVIDRVERTLSEKSGITIRLAPRRSSCTSSIRGFCNACRPLINENSLAQQTTMPAKIATALFGEVDGGSMTRIGSDASPIPAAK